MVGDFRLVLFFLIRSSINKYQENNLIISCTIWGGIFARFDSIENFEAVYTRAFPIMDRIMQLVLDQGFDLSSFFPDDEINSEDPPYLILKYATNYKKPMHENFQYYQWFATQVKDYITYEEVDDGFIRFYKREVDFLNDNMIRTTKEGLQNWIESKRAKIPPKLCRK